MYLEMLLKEFSSGTESKVPGLDLLGSVGLSPYAVLLSQLMHCSIYDNVYSILD